MTDELQGLTFEWLSLMMVGPVWAALGSGFAVITPNGIQLTPTGVRYLSTKD